MGNQPGQYNLFNQILLQSIDEILTALGDSAYNTIQLFLTQQKGLTREQLPEHIKEFHEVLSNIFGVGAGPIEKHLIALIEFRLNVKCPASVKAQSIADCIDFLRAEFKRTQLSPNK